MIRIRKSTFAMIISGLYLIISLAAFLTHIISVQTNPGDSGLSAVWFLLCTLPWMILLTGVLPADFVYTQIWSMICYPIGWVCVFFNAFILYCVCGGLQWKKN